MLSQVLGKRPKEADPLEQQSSAVKASTKVLPKIRIVFDIDSVIAGHEKIDKNTFLFFLRKGAVITAGDATHFIFPGIIHLIRTIYQHPNIEVAFFSSGTQERNMELVEKLLTLCLDKEHYEKINSTLKICSKADLSDNADNDVQNLYRQFGLYKGNKVKDLCKIVTDGNLKHTIFIDDSVSYIKYGQQGNFLQSNCVESSHYNNLAYEGYAKESWHACNNAFYLAGRLTGLINTLNGSESSVSDVLFPIQFQPKKDELMKYEFNWNATKEKAMYDLGLKKLKELESSLEFYTHQTYCQAIQQEASPSELLIIDESGKKLKSAQIF